MAKFINLLLKNGPKIGDEKEWSMIIDSIDELVKFSRHDSGISMKTYLNMERDKNGKLKTDHIGTSNPRTIGLTNYLNMKILSTKEGEKMYPILEVASLNDRKYENMYRMIQNGVTVRVNPAGGYCSLSSYIKTWNASVLEEISKDDLGFPVDKEVLKVDTIILENADRGWIGPVESMAENIPNAGTIKTIYNLKEVDRKYTAECILNCKNVVISSSFMDDEQVDAFMNLFAKMPSKNVYLKAYGNLDKITGHPLFKKNESVHNINFNTF